MKAAILIAVLLLTGCKISDVQYPAVVRSAEVQCQERQGLHYADAVQYDTVFSIDVYCKDGTRIQYKLKRDDR